MYHCYWNVIIPDIPDISGPTSFELFNFVSLCFSKERDTTNTFIQIIFTGNQLLSDLEISRPTYEAELTNKFYCPSTFAQPSTLQCSLE